MRTDGSDYPAHDELRSGVRIKELEENLAECKQTLDAIRGGDVDAILVSTERGDQIYTLTGAEAPYRILFEQMNEGAATISEDGVIMYCNKSLAQMMRNPLERTIGSNLFSYVHPESEGRFREMIRDSMNTSVRDDLMFIANDGTKVAMQLSVSFLLTEVPTFCIVAADLTERIEAEESLRRANEELDIKVKERTKALARSNAELQHFAYVASHDLQEPLRMVTAYLSLLEEKHGDVLKGQAREYMDFAIEGGVRARRLVSDLLELTHLESQAKPMSATDMNVVMDAAVQNLMVQIKEEHAVVTRDSLPEIMADDTQMTVLLQNLLSNAIKFHDDRTPVVHVSFQDQGDQWLFSVSDNGIGIDPAYKDKMFVMFQRLHSRRKYEGTGIGLAIAKKIVERHGGRIWFDSEIGKGTTFYFTLTKGG